MIKNTIVESIKNVGISGWVVVDGFTWYGPYNSFDSANERIGAKDSLGMTIKGNIVEII